MDVSCVGCRLHREDEVLSRLPLATQEFAIVLRCDVHGDRLAGPPEHETLSAVDRKRERRRTTRVSHKLVGRRTERAAHTAHRLSRDVLKKKDDRLQ